MKKITVTVEGSRIHSIKVTDSAIIIGTDGSVTIEDTTLANQKKTSDSSPQSLFEQGIFLGYPVVDWINLRNYLGEFTNQDTPKAILESLKVRWLAEDPWKGTQGH